MRGKARRCGCHAHDRDHDITLIVHIRHATARSTPRHRRSSREYGVVLRNVHVASVPALCWGSMVHHSRALTPVGDITFRRTSRDIYVY